MSDETISQLIEIADGSQAEAKPLRQNFNYLDGRINTLSSSINNKETLSHKGTANGYCPLDSNALIPSNKLNMSEIKSSLEEDSTFIDEIISSTSDKDLSNLSDTGKAKFDGQWVRSVHYSAIENVTKDTLYTLNLSSYLPNDNFNYEVMINLRAYRGADSMSHVYVKTDIWNWLADPILEWEYSSQGSAGGSGRQVSNTFILPVGTGRKIMYEIAINNMSHLRLTVWGYRRIGTSE